MGGKKHEKREMKLNTTGNQFADASSDKCQEFEDYVKAIDKAIFVLNL